MRRDAIAIAIALAVALAVLSIPLGMVQAELSDFSAVCKEIGEKEAVVAIAWVLANPAVTSAIVGPRTVGHLDGLDRAAELKLDQTCIDRLNEIFDINTGRQLKNNVPAPYAFAW